MPDGLRRSPTCPVIDNLTPTTMSTSSSVSRGERPRRLLSPVDLAAYLAVSRTSVYRIIDRRIIPFHRVSGLIRFRPDDVNAYLAATRVGAVNVEQL